MFKKLWKMNLGLILFLNKELLKKRTPAALVNFLYTIVKNYFKAYLNEYKNLFLILDPEYRKQKAEYDKYQQAKKDVINATKLLMYVKSKLKKAGISRQRIRRYFADLGKNDDLMKELTDELLRELK